MDERKRKFKVGDIVTYKSKDVLPGNEYYFGGESESPVGKIKKYSNYSSVHKCYQIIVSHLKNFRGEFTMLESEFEEFDNISNYEIY